MVPEINENQNLDNQIEEPDTQTKDDSQEIQTENNQEQDDSNNNQLEALENEGEENDNWAITTYYWWNIKSIHW